MEHPDHCVFGAVHRRYLLAHRSVLARRNGRIGLQIRDAITKIQKGAFYDKENPIHFFLGRARCVRTALLA